MLRRAGWPSTRCRAHGRAPHAGTSARSLTSCSDMRRLLRRRTQSARTAAADKLETIRSELVKADHQRTMRVNTFRGPIRSAQRAAWNLENRVRQGKNADHPAPLRSRQVQVTLHLIAGYGNTDPVKIRDNGQEKKQSEDSMTIAHDSKAIMSHRFRPAGKTPCQPPMPATYLAEIPSYRSRTRCGSRLTRKTDGGESIAVHTPYRPRLPSNSASRRISPRFWQPQSPPLEHTMISATAIRRYWIAGCRLGAASPVATSIRKIPRSG